VSADYSQIELRVLAHMSGDRVLSEAFMNDEDVHQRTAAEVFGVSPQEVTPAMRSRAKAINFGIIYGMSEFGLAKDLGISRGEAGSYIDKYFTRYAGVRDWIERTIQDARANGYVTTLLKRRRYLPDLHSKNPALRRFAERTAMNTPIQGSAADIIKIAMVRIHERLREDFPSCKMILQVHDELVIEGPAQYEESIKSLLKREMEHAYPMSVPLKVQVGSGGNWDQAKGSGGG